jgi:peptide deformylase
MAVLSIITAPHPVLAEPALEVREDEFGEELAQLVGNMTETMYDAPGVGLAAPQVNDARRILVVDSCAADEPGLRFFAMVNPKILERSKDTIPWRETCLSVPEFDIEIQRSKKIRVRWQNAMDGSTTDAWFEDYESVIVQHEIDHLDGTILLDRASRFKRTRYLKRVAKARRHPPEAAL